VTESPLWDAQSRRLHFVDIYGGAICSQDWETSRLESLAMGEAIGSIALTDRVRLICALVDTVALVNLEDGSRETLASIHHAAANCRLNDGRCDLGGRFWVGSMVESLDSAAGALYRVTGDGTVTTVATGFICSNGLAWSPDYLTMYHADSRQKTVWQYDYDITTGSATNRRIFFISRDGEGRPDGAAVDEEGCYWIARYDGWRIVRHAPDGREIFTLNVPVQNPTMCAFAGDDRSTLVFTSARGRLSQDQLRNQPQAGSVFAVDVGVRGLSEPRFRIRTP
jgi:L-arabinonolactonase